MPTYLVYKHIFPHFASGRIRSRIRFRGKRLRILIPAGKDLNSIQKLQLFLDNETWNKLAHKSKIITFTEKKTSTTKIQWSF